MRVFAEGEVDIAGGVSYALVRPDNLGEAPSPDRDGLAVIAELDPQGARATVFEDNPPEEAHE